jgi:hypothetical protein
VHRIVSSPLDACEEVLLTLDIVPEIERGGGGLFGRNLV